MQAIVTKYLGPAGLKGARIKATAAGDSCYTKYDYGLSDQENHAAAAEKLCTKFEWRGTYCAGHLPDGLSMVWVCPEYATRGSHFKLI